MSSDTSLAQLRIVLVEPAGPLNIGSAARVMKNFGLSQLILVNPQCDPYSVRSQLLPGGGICKLPLNPLR